MALEALSLLCVHLQSLEDLYSLTIKFSHSPSSLSEIINAVAQHIEDTWGFLLEWDYKGIVSPATLRVYANTLTNFGSPRKSIIGFWIVQSTRPAALQSMSPWPIWDTRNTTE